ncbi:pyroglutamyl-peptidase I [Brachybacterium paraconglomeratum]|uniref:pyroglutamyl-peptidase I n=1 Tax=Brachybacterium paraconglomeratum TaxID=173362 RepID=UPI0021A2DCBD|nr:pyroglutamyl-peptidase I [Brachybacterium paraconglomeratum]MCT1910247.1 pyroglutamyl-peptidase I [Brachybacterium paraconglomeratum]
MAIDVLLSGFAPFDGAATNESWEAVREAVPALVARGVDAEAVELPVEFGTASERLEEAVRGLRPRLVVAVGLAAGRTAITPERVAINIRDARIPDNAGASPVDEPVVPGAPVGRFSTLPVKAMVASIAADGLPAAVSQTAGTYVCNDVFYALQHLLATDPALEGIRGGFVHVPSASVVDSPTAARALVRMVEVALSTEADVRLAGGAEH